MSDNHYNKFLMSYVPLVHPAHEPHHYDEALRNHHKHPKRRGHWIAPHPHLEGWVVDIVKEAEVDVVKYRKGEIQLLPAIQMFYDTIKTNSILWMYFEEMIYQPVIGKPYKMPKSPFDSIDSLMVAMNIAVMRGPMYDETALVGCPLNAVVDYCSATSAGFAVFRDPIVNKLLKGILLEWCKFLSGPESCEVLNDSKTGWLSDHAKEKMGFHQFVHDPKAPHHGFKSWNDFFTRRFVDGARPIASPDDDTVITSSCESTPHCLQHGVKLRDKFWIKRQPYSLLDMLDKDELAEQFKGGTVYQAFLSALCYHRWHSPVNGTIVKTKHIDGSYYSEAESEGFHISGIDHCEGYLTSVAARCFVFIQADNPNIGLMAVLYVGMGEVSSNVFLDHIKPGYKVRKGEELGYFQFGGSTHCLIFREGTIKGFEVQVPGENVIHMGAHIATSY